MNQVKKVIILFNSWFETSHKQKKLAIIANIFYNTSGGLDFLLQESAFAARVSIFASSPQNVTGTETV